jgi:hypothetical protein
LNALTARVVWLYGKIAVEFTLGFSVKASELKVLILSELEEFGEFRPSKDSWVSATSILSKLGVSDQPFARSVLQSLIEQRLLNHRGGEKLPQGGFELLIQPNQHGANFLKTASSKSATENKGMQKPGDVSAQNIEKSQTEKLSEKPLVKMAFAVFATVLAAMVLYLFSHHLGLQL